jgi:uncharacterized membrane protein
LKIYSSGKFNKKIDPIVVSKIVYIKLSDAFSTSLMLAFISDVDVQSAKKKQKTKQIPVVVNKPNEKRENPREKKQRVKS